MSNKDKESTGFEGEADPGLSLDDLSEAYAELVVGGHGDDPYVPAEAPANPDASADWLQEVDAESTPDADEGCEISPRTIVEAMLFVGHPENQPLTSRQVASMMRGVSPREIDQAIEELNWTYQSQGAPYHIVSVDKGYVMQLREEFGPLRDRFFGRVKAAKLSQPALDVLAIVAYNQGLTREQVGKLRGAKCAALLRQLVRRGLLRIERPEGASRTLTYFTTDRFLDLVGIQSIDELPQSE